jgi:plastocyanin
MGVIAVLVLSQLAACGRDDGKKSDSAPLSGRSAEVVDFRTSDEGGKPTTEVVAQDNRFVPENIRISPGQTVRWKNQGQNQHNIMGTGESTEYAPDFGVPDTDFAPGSGTYEFTFDKPGVYLY